MRSGGLKLIVFLALSACGGGPSEPRLIPKGNTQTFIYVSPSGDDAAEGSIERPFQTIERAQRKVRELTAGMQGSIDVVLRGGKYVLSAPLRFDSSDSGRNGFSVTYRSQEREEPILTGAKTLTGFSAFQPSIVRKYVGSVNFRQLYVNGQRAIRARSPNGDFSNRVHSFDHQNKLIRIRSDQMPAVATYQHLELSLATSWTDHHFLVEGADSTGDFVDLRLEEPARSLFFQYAALNAPAAVTAAPLFFENDIALMDQPGEFFLDRSAGMLYYRLRANEVAHQLVAEIPLLETLVVLEGGLNAERLQNLKFSGLTFEGSNFSDPSDDGWHGLQAGFARIGGGIKLQSAALEIENAENVIIEKNTFRKLGAMAIGLKSGTKNVVVRANHIYDISGIAIGAGLQSLLDYNYTMLTYDPHRLSNDDKIESNYIHDIGLDFTGSVGILAGYVRNIQITNNELWNLPYSAISLGWGWTHQLTLMRSNHVSANRIWGCNQIHDDGGGIYTLSRQPETLITKNFVSNLVRSPWAWVTHIAGVYLDQGSHEISVLDNALDVFEKTHSAPNTMNTFQNNSELSATIIAESGLLNDHSHLRMKFPIQKRIGFGGMYSQFVSATLNVSFHNPATGALSCPSGYTSTQVLGSNPLSGYSHQDSEVFYCWKVLGPAEVPVFEFGGIYGGRYDSGRDFSGPQPITIGHSRFPNPITGKNDESSCPSGFTRQIAAEVSGHDYPLYYCVRPPNSSSSIAEFGGLVGYRRIGATAEHEVLVNPLSGSSTCLPGYRSQYVYGTYFASFTMNQPASDLRLTDHPVKLCFR